MMMKTRLIALAFALTALAAPTVGLRAATPPPSAPKKLEAPLPKVDLHTEFVVEVNKLGQVVRVRSGKSSKDTFFNAQTYGNVLQMWIRHPDGSAEVGLYRVTYDYSAKTHKVSRNFALVKPGGTWADKQGAATEMMEKADAETRAAQAQQQKQNSQLPSLDKIIASPTPTKHP